MHRVPFKDEGPLKAVYCPVQGSFRVVFQSRLTIEISIPRYCATCILLLLKVAPRCYAFACRLSIGTASMFTTKDQFEKSILFKRYETIPVQNVLNDGYECYFTVPIEDGIVIAIQLHPTGQINMLRASAEGTLSPEQKTKIFQFVCDFICGDGSHEDADRMTGFVQQFAGKLEAGQINNTFLLAGFNVGFLTNEDGGMKGIECQTTQADSWEAAFK